MFLKILDLIVIFHSSTLSYRKYIVHKGFLSSPLFQESLSASFNFLFFFFLDRCRNRVKSTKWLRYVSKAEMG